jgi:hypothetical protein
VRRLLNNIAPRRPLNPPPLPPAVEDWSPSDFATDPSEAWILADEEIQAAAEEDAAADNGPS